MWRTNKKEQFRDIRMNVHLFGKVDSPCCCLWALLKTATDSITNIIARAKEAITENFYMDDYLDSFNAQSEAMEISQQVMAALKEESFRLTKWTSNDSHILGTLPLSEISAASVNLDPDDTSIERGLGILWNPQSLWKEKVDWNNEIPYNLNNRFEKWKENLKNWNAVKIPRWYYLDKNNNTELHIFIPASASAYGAVAYFRCKYQDKFKCSFIINKTRLAPINEKQLTIPCLELQAAALGCRMRSVIVEETKCEFRAVYL